MEQNCQNVNLDPKHLFDQLTTARNEINNLRQQIKSLRYKHEKDVDNIRRLLGLCSDGITVSETTNPEEASTSDSQDDSLLLKPIGVISTWFPNKRGTPRQTGICEKALGKIELFNSVFTNPEHALEGLNEFSHMWILFHFHRNDSTHVRAKVAPPRLNGVRIGVFSTRSPHRPCPIGLSLVKIIKIEGKIIYFEGTDMIDQTPLLDLKPFIPQYDNPTHIEKLCLRRSNPDVSQDEELALRLQAEEFHDSSSTFDGLYGNAHSNFRNPAVSSDSQYLRQTTFPEPRDNQSSNSNLRLDETTGPAQESIVEPSNEQLSQSSRLLEGADGPRTICGTDADLSNRRSLSSRLDSSPIRMGVREAPDGEENFESQTLTPSQTVPNIPAAARILQGALPESASIALTPISGEEVRVPDWVGSRLGLSVVFNDRALAQMNEILDDKADGERQAIENVLREDPRSVYLRQRWGNQFYTFLIHDLHITCRFDDARKVVTVFQVKHAGTSCSTCREPEWQCLGHSPLA